MIDRDRLVKTFRDLVQIDSESGNETAKAEELTRRLQSLGFEVETDDYGNVIAHEEGDSPFMLSGHLDTVSPGNGIKPIVDGDRIASDGTTIGGGDDNAGLAIILETLTSMRGGRYAVHTRRGRPYDERKSRVSSALTSSISPRYGRGSRSSSTARGRSIASRWRVRRISPTTSPSPGGPLTPESSRKTASRPSASPRRSSRDSRRGGSMRRPPSASGPSKAAPRATPCLRAPPLPASSAP